MYGTNCKEHARLGDMQDYGSRHLLNAEPFIFITMNDIKNITLFCMKVIF